MNCINRLHDVNRTRVFLYFEASCELIDHVFWLDDFFINDMDGVSLMTMKQVKKRRFIINQ